MYLPVRTYVLTYNRTSARVFLEFGSVGGILPCLLPRDTVDYGTVRTGTGTYHRASPVGGAGRDIPGHPTITADQRLDRFMNMRARSRKKEEKDHRTKPKT